MEKVGVFKVIFLFFYVFVVLVFGLLRQWVSSGYRSTSPVRSTDRVFDCGKRWVRVDGKVSRLLYIFCHGTAWEDRLFRHWIVEESCSIFGRLDSGSGQ